MEAKHRIVWIDAARGVGIFLIVLGHTPLPGFVFQYLFSFHVPLFFFISGLLFQKEKFPTWQSFLAHRGRRLLLSYAVFCVLIFLYWIIWGHNTAYEPMGTQPFWGIFYGSNALKFIFTPLWFLPCLFLTENIFYLLEKYFKHAWLIFSIILLAVIGIIYGRLGLPHLPWSFEVMPVALSFYFLGFVSKDYLVKTRIDWFLPLIFMASLIFALLNSRVDLLNHTYGNWFLFYIAALSGIGLIIGFAQLWPGKILQRIGRYALYIFALHQVFLHLLRYLTNQIWPSFNFGEIGKINFLIGLGLTVAAIGCCYLVILIYQKLVLRFDFFQRK